MTATSFKAILLKSRFHETVVAFLKQLDVQLPRPLIARALYTFTVYTFTLHKHTTYSKTTYEPTGEQYLGHVDEPDQLYCRFWVKWVV